MKETVFYGDLVKSFPSMEGKNVLITGCTSGTGFVLAKTCVTLGAKVYLLNRPSQRASSALRQLQIPNGPDPVHIDCDLQSFESVKKAAGHLKNLLREEGCHVLCNNAGVMGLLDRATVDGYDIQIQTNHLSHFLLTSRLWPLLEKAASSSGEARVISHSSGARKMGKKPIIAKYFEQNGGNLGGDTFPGLQKWYRYQQSKLANLLGSYALHDRRPEGVSQKIKILTAHPGPTDSGLQAKTYKAGGKGFLDKFIINRTLKVAQSVEDGTAGLATCTCAPYVNSGEFYGPEGSGQPGPAVLLPKERDLTSELLLWELSLKATGIKDFFEGEM
ncbi:SDR family NAD(P)-dependent oxidoreductase [Spirochaeta cellobiosiphila]|uniref:SDR family NAD(P)-dependent oxidoreductase n=1 Tax=Spirochaeta cellobiosiphila TaxID=504483 RepID=UPI00040CC770|nr:SDR family NAD(P)-dependent oxidoreductase [Spirochaeta cellobiosiphila]